MEILERRGRNHITAPNQRGSFSVRCHWPHLIKRERDVVAAARIIENVSRLIISARASVGGAERGDAVTIHIEKFPIQFRFERTGTAADSGFGKEPGKLFSDF